MYIRHIAVCINLLLLLLPWVGFVRERKKNSKLFRMKKKIRIKVSRYLVSERVTVTMQIRPSLHCLNGGISAGCLGWERGGRSRGGGGTRWSSNLEF